MSDAIRPALTSIPHQNGFGRLLRGLAIRIGALPWLPDFLPQITAVDKFIQRRTRGQLSLLRMACLPGVLLTIPGRKSGIPRTAPLLCVPYGDGVLIAGSNFGGPTLPSWVNNLRAATHAAVTVQGQKTSTVATELTGADRDQAWVTMLEMWPNYAKYAARTERIIPVFWLRPVR